MATLPANGLEVLFAVLRLFPMCLVQKWSEGQQGWWWWCAERVWRWWWDAMAQFSTSSVKSHAKHQTPHQNTKVCIRCCRAGWPWRGENMNWHEFDYVLMALMLPTWSNHPKLTLLLMFLFTNHFHSFVHGMIHGVLIFIVQAALFCEGYKHQDLPKRDFSREVMIHVVIHVWSRM